MIEGTPIFGDLHIIHVTCMSVVQNHFPPLSMASVADRCGARESVAKTHPTNVKILGFP